MIADRPMKWRVGAGNWEVSGREYEFRQFRDGEPRNITVANLLILPTGRFAGSMNEIYDAAGDYLKQLYGAAQLQVLVPGGVPDETRRQIVQEMLGAAEPVLVAMRHGGKS
jgi:hypothetical protein